MAADWPFLTVGRFSEVFVRTGLTVCCDQKTVGLDIFSA
jgi:hypothetical protein